jgi:hypothetical protein
MVQQRLWMGLFCVSALVCSLGFASALADFSAEEETALEPLYPAFHISNPVSRTLQKCLGINALATWVSESFLTKALSKKLEGELNLEIQPYSGFDLLSGKAEQIALHGEHVVYNQFLSLTALEVATHPETPLFVSLNRRPAVLRPLQATVKAVITEQDLNALFHTRKGRRYLSNIKLKMPPIGEHRVDFLSPVARIENDRLVFSALLNVTGAPLENALPIEASGRLIADPQEGSLRLVDLEIEAEGISDLRPLAGFVENYFGQVLSYAKLKVKGHRVAVSMDPPQLTPRQMILQGQVTVAPQPTSLLKSNGAASGSVPRFSATSIKKL